jgi:predicted HTH transcriptional regulator
MDKWMSVVTTRIEGAKLSDREVERLEMCRERGRITIGEASKITGISRNTIKDHIASLTKNGHLFRHGAGRGAWYST